MLNFNTYVPETNKKSQTLVNPLQKGLTGAIASPQYKYNLSADIVCFSGKSQGQSALEEKTVIGKLNNTDKLITQAGVFLEEIKEKLDYDLKSKEKNQLIETKRLLAEKELELKKLAESIKQDEERKKLESATNNLNQVKETLAARKMLNNKKAIIRQEALKEAAKTQQPTEQEEKSFISKLNKIDISTMKICIFLDRIKEKPDFKLKTKEKSQLKETEKLLAEKTAYLQSLSEKIKKEDEKQKLETVKKNLNKLNEVLAARTTLNAQKQPKKPVVYVDMPEQTKKEPVQKPEASIKEEIEKLNQIKGSKNQASQRDLLVKKVCGINEKLNKITYFLETIEKKPDNLLKPRDKSQLIQVKPILAKVEDQLVEIQNQAEKIKEQNQKEINIKHTREKIEQINQALKARVKIKLSDCKPHNSGLTALVDLTYKNSLNLKSTPNFSDEDFKKNLKTNVPGIINTNKAAKRISSLSVYLKEKMIGFEVPEYELKEEKKGGYQWFERGLENLLIGSEKANLKPEEYQNTAKKLFGILAVHDNYWKSPEFSDYLSSLKTSTTITENQKKAVDATVLAIKELNEPKQITFGSQEIISMGERAFTPMKFMHEIYEKCAYTGNHLDRESDDEEFRPSADHIIPHSWENSKNDDGNFIISSMESNTVRGNISLIKYLKGYNAL